MSNGSERREYKRLSVDIPVKITFKNKDGRSMVPIDATILDISLGGAFIHCTMPIVIGQELLLQIEFEKTSFLEGRVIIHKQDSTLKTPTRGVDASIVRWVRGSSKSGFGVEFTDLHPDRKTFLERLIQSYPASEG